MLFPILFFRCKLLQGNGLCHSIIENLKVPFHFLISTIAFDSCPAKSDEHV